MRILVSLLPAALLAAPPAASLAAQAPRWKELGRTVVGNTVYVDQRTMKRAQGVVTGTFRVAFAKPVKSPRGDITSSRTVASLDCAKRLVAIRENTYFHDEKANRVYDHKVVGTPGWAPPMGGSMPEVAMARLCATK